MNSESSFKDKLRMVMNGENYTPWAQRHGISPVTVLGWLNGGSLYPKSWDKLIKATGIPKEWWISGKGEPIRTSPVENDQSVLLSTRTPSSALTDLGEHAYTPPSNDAICMPHSVHTQPTPVGEQQDSPNNIIINVMISAADWQNHVGLNPDHIKVITVHGNNMQPLLQHGDQVLVDTTCHTFIDDGIYAIQYGAHLQIKRIRLRLDGCIEVISDVNLGFGPEVYNQDKASQFVIYGKILPFKFGKMCV